MKFLLGSRYLIFVNKFFYIIFCKLTFLYSGFLNRTQLFHLGVHENNAKPSKGILWLLIYPHYYVKSNRRLNNSNQPLSVILELLASICIVLRLNISWIKSNLGNYKKISRFFQSKWLVDLNNYDSTKFISRYSSCCN